MTDFSFFKASELKKKKTPMHRYRLWGETTIVSDSIDVLLSRRYSQSESINR